MTEEARTHDRIKTVYSISGAGKNGQIHANNMKLNNFLTPYTKSKPKMD